MSDESPPPYSAVLADHSVRLPVSESRDSEATLPFGYSERLASKIQALVSEGQMLDSRFKDVRDVVSASAKFEYQEHALVLSQRFETLLWESRNIAGIALVAIKDFNEVVLDFLSEQDVVVQDRLKELVNTSKLLQRERNSVTNQKSSFDALVKGLGDFRQMIHLESAALVQKRRKQSHSGGRGTKGARPSRKLQPPFVVPRPEPTNGPSIVTVSLGAISRTCMDYVLRFEHIAEQAVFPSCVISSTPEAPAQDANSDTALSNPPERKRLLPSIEHAESAVLLGLIDTLVRDLRTFVNLLDVFDIVFAELARAQDIFILYLKDGQSVANQGYSFEIKRLRRRLPCVCNALDAYSKAKLS